MRRVKNLMMLVAAMFAAMAVAAPPKLQKQGDTQQLLVDGKPFLILGGELGNSSASSAEYMKPHWPRLRAMHLNTVLAPVYWELIEPSRRQVRLDFGRCVAARRARARPETRDPVVRRVEEQHVHLRAVVGEARFRAFSARAGGRRHERGDSLRVLAEHAGRGCARVRGVHGASRKGRLARHHRAHGAGGKRDRHVAHRARARRGGGQGYGAAVPAELMRALAARGEKLEPELLDRWKKNGSKSSGTWAQVFGADEWGQEVFTAWHYARFVEALVKAGKASYDMPMFANVALNRTGRKPGEYPSGGPLPHLIDVWKAGAPSLDFLAPDIYFPNFSQLAARYRRADNMLFIPEANNATNPQGPANAFIPSASSTRSASRRSPSSRWAMRRIALSQSYEVLEQLTPLILANRGTGPHGGIPRDDQRGRQRHRHAGEEDDGRHRIHRDVHRSLDAEGSADHRQSRRSGDSLAARISGSRARESPSLSRERIGDRCASASSSPRKVCS